MGFIWDLFFTPNKSQGFISLTVAFASTLPTTYARCRSDHYFGTWPKKQIETQRQRCSRRRGDMEPTMDTHHRKADHFGKVARKHTGSATSTVVMAACGFGKRLDGSAMFACRRGEPSELTFPSFCPGLLVHVAINPTTRFHRFSLFAKQHCEQVERAFPFFFPVPLVGVTSTPQMRFIFLAWASCRSGKQSTRVSIFLSWGACRLSVQPALSFPVFFSVRMSAWRAVQPHVSIFLSWAA